MEILSGIMSETHAILLGDRAMPTDQIHFPALCFGDAGSSVGLRNYIGLVPPLIGRIKVALYPKMWHRRKEGHCAHSHFYIPVEHCGNIQPKSFNRGNMFLHMEQDNENF